MFKTIKIIPNNIHMTISVNNHQSSNTKKAFVKYRKNHQELIFLRQKTQ